MGWLDSCFRLLGFLHIFLNALSGTWGFPGPMIWSYCTKLCSPSSCTHCSCRGITFPSCQRFRSFLSLILDFCWSWTIKPSPPGRDILNQLYSSAPKPPTHLAQHTAKPTNTLSTRLSVINSCAHLRGGCFHGTSLWHSTCYHHTFQLCAGTDRADRTEWVKTENKHQCWALGFAKGQVKTGKKAGC